MINSKKAIKIRQETNRVLLNKRAITLTPNEIIELILVIAGMFLLIVAFLHFTNPGFDVNKETAKSYLATLEKEIEKADNRKTGEFMIWQPEIYTHFYLVYFGNKRTCALENFGDVKRSSFTFGKNNLCVCYTLKGKSYCSECVSLGYPAKSDDAVRENFAFGVGRKVVITKQGKRYLLSGNFEKGSNYYLEKILSTEAEIDGVKAKVSDHVVKSLDMWTFNADFWNRVIRSGGSVNNLYVVFSFQTEALLINDGAGAKAMDFSKKLFSEIKKIADPICPEYILKIPEGAIGSGRTQFVSENELLPSDAETLTLKWSNPATAKINYKGQNAEIRYWQLKTCR